MTVLGALVPGAGLLWARRWSGLLLLLPTLLALGLVGFEYATRGLRPTSTGSSTPPTCAPLRWSVQR